LDICFTPHGPTVEKTGAVGKILQSCRCAEITINGGVDVTISVSLSVHMRWFFKPLGMMDNGRSILQLGADLIQPHLGVAIKNGIQNSSLDGL
jgi:hypothetical protein